MSLSAEVLDALLQAGATAEMIVAAVKADSALDDARKARRREGNATRQRRYREAHTDSNASNALRSVTRRDGRDAPPKVSPKENNQTPSSPPVEVSEAIASSPQPRPWTLPAGVSLQVWTDLLGNRRRKRLGTSGTAWKHFQDDLGRVSSQTGIPPPKLIEMCTAKGWGAIYDPTEKSNERSGKASDGLSSTARAAIEVFGR